MDIERDSSPVCTRDHVAWYYREAFPYQHLEAWLAHDSEQPLAHREFAFNNCQWRYKQFQNVKRQLKTYLCQQAPERFDIGAVYSVPVEQHRDGAIEERELVFDIDLNDYGVALRNACCGDKKQLCVQCWPYLVIAARILHIQLTQHLNFKRVRYVFSGRRGLHVWVSDAVARQLSDAQRKWLVVGMQSSVHSWLHSAPELLFEEQPGSSAPSGGLWRMSVLSTARQWFEGVFLEYTPHFDDIDALFNHLSESYPEWRALRWPIEMVQRWRMAPTMPNRHERWEELVYGLEYSRLDYLIDAIVCHYAYPRCDTVVSQRQNHLLKAPFCIHPATKLLCVPFANQNPFEWDPCTLPPFPSIHHLRHIDKYPRHVAYFNQAVDAF